MLLQSCSSDLEKVKEIQISTDENFPVESLEGARLIYSDSAIVRVVLHAANMERFVGQEANLKLSNGLHVYFYNPLGKPESELKAQEATIDEVNNIMEAVNQVQVLNSQGDLLETEHLIWNQETEKVYTEEFVKITTKDEVIFGKGLESNQDFTKYVIKKLAEPLCLTTAMSDSVIIFICILLSAFFSGMEIAFVSANKLKVELDKQSGKVYSKLLEGVLQSPARFIATMLVGNNIALVVYGVMMAKLLAPFIADYSQSSFVVLLFQTIISTLIILVTAEFLPKVFFALTPINFSNSLPFHCFFFITYYGQLFG